MGLLAIITVVIALGNEEEFDKILSISNNKTIQLRGRSDVMRVAKALGQTVITEPFNSELYPVQSSFTYQGWKIIAVYSIGEE